MAIYFSAEVKCYDQELPVEEKPTETTMCPSGSCYNCTKCEFTDN